MQIAKCLIPNFKFVFNGNLGGYSVSILCWKNIGLIYAPGIRYSAEPSESVANSDANFGLIIKKAD